jgi:hypothetical protein
MNHKHKEQLQRAYETGVISFLTLDNRTVTCRAEEINALVYNENTPGEHVATVHSQNYPVNYGQLKKLRWFLLQEGRKQYDRF